MTSSLGKFMAQSNSLQKMVRVCSASAEAMQNDSSGKSLCRACGADSS